MSWAGRASEAEFRYRWYWILAIYLVGFGCFPLDRRSSAAWLAGKVAGSVHAPPGRAELRVLLFLAALLACAAAALRTWAAAYLDSRVVHDSLLHAEQLVATGPYRHLRNPLYLGGILLAAAFGAYANPIGFLVLIGGHAVLYARLIAREEAELTRSQGERFLAYRRKVPALWPSPRPRVLASGARPAWAQAWGGEMLMWLFAALLLCVASFGLRLLSPGIIAAFLIWFLFGRRFRRGLPARAAEP
ncbi:MAG: methyltransferase family protein [Terriglobales bacterium]